MSRKTHNFNPDRPRQHGKPAGAPVWGNLDMHPSVDLSGLDENERRAIKAGLEGDHIDAAVEFLKEADQIDAETPYPSDQAVANGAPAVAAHVETPRGTVPGEPLSGKQ